MVVQKQNATADNQAIALLLSDPYRLDFITAHYRNIRNTHLFSRHLQHS